MDLMSTPALIDNTPIRPLDAAAGQAPRNQPRLKGI
jgi:hypothetical protein